MLKFLTFFVATHRVQNRDTKKVISVRPVRFFYRNQSRYRFSVYQHG
uniref:Uncharacterized protein n=1 Tax=Klebsiella pneumoniae TaxID=573 RepID=A0A8B0SSI0_KLEPN|nr:hypothetical protein [Klebsiella pneumoniae]